MFNENCDPKFLHRSFPILTDEGIKRLGKCTVASAGCGGIAGSTMLTLARMGVKKFYLSDPANFDLPDMNRQWGATHKALGRRKVDVYREMLLDIHPDAEIKLFPEGITSDNNDRFLEGADILIDCLDVSVPYELRERLHENARGRGLFSVAAPMLGFGCAAICSSPSGMSMKAWTSTFKHTKANANFPEILKKIFMPEHLNLIGQSLQYGKVPSVAVSVITAGALLSTECVAYVLDGVIPGSRKPITLPRVMLFDLFRMSYYVVDAGMILKEIEEEVE